MKILLHTLPCVFALMFAATTNADILALYDFEQSDPPPALQNTINDQTTASVFSTPGVTANDYTTLTNQAAFQNSGGIRTNLDTAVPHGYARGSVTQNILPATFSALPSNNVVYHEFTIQATSGTWQLDRLHFDYWVDRPEFATSYAATVYTDLIDGQLDSQSPNIPDDPNNRNRDFSLSLLSGITLSAGDTATFRIAFTDNANSGNAIHRLDNITLEGSLITAVPEPAAATMLFLAGALIAIRRRRG